MLNSNRLQCRNAFRLFVVGLFLNVGCLFGQEYGLKILSVKDFSYITEDMRNFDSVWYQCMSKYGHEDVSHYFHFPLHKTSSTHPLTSLNFIDGFDAPLSDAFYFKLVKTQRFNDTLHLYHMDMGWMQMAVYFDVKNLKLIPFEQVDPFHLQKCKYKNLTVYYLDRAVDKKQVEKAYADLVKSVTEMGVKAENFTNREFVVYSANSIADSYRLIGSLEFYNYFDAKGITGGMSDPHNNVILSGVRKPIHTHELIHLVVDFKSNRFVGEGLASLYGGIGAEPYQDKLAIAIGYLKKNNIHSFAELFQEKFFYDTEFNTNRVEYALAALMLEKVRQQFGLVKYQAFIRKCKTNDEMIESLMDLFQMKTEEALFEYLYLK